MAASQTRLYSSIDSGATWIEQQPAGNVDAYWTCCSNSDGSHLFVGNYAGGRLYALAVNPLTHTLAVAKAGNGTVTLDPAGGTYDYGMVVTLTATPATGYTFTGWSGDLSGTTNPTTITMDADKSVTATFTSSTTTPGDVDGNGSVTMVDALLAARAAVGITTLTGSAFQAADVNSDGIITMVDVLLIARIAVGI
jgi:uncharacterized repeat protein (TIGR02543 family)